MNSLNIIVAICCYVASAKAKPGVGHSHLVGIPDAQSFGAIRYPKYNLLELGEYSKGHVPATEIHETKHITIQEPQPYPVRIPVPHPYPVEVHKPYPVVQTKFVKVPHAVPYEIVKPVPVPVEVPKPYPVEVNSNVHGGLYGGDLSHAGTGQVQQTQGVHEFGNDVRNLAGGEGQFSSYGGQNQEEQGYGGGYQEGHGGFQGVQQDH